MFSTKYPYIKDNRLLASGLDNDLEFSRGNSPPQGDAGGAGQYKYWMDTSTTPPTLRMCTTPRATAGAFIPTEWITIATVDVVNNIFHLDSSTINIITPPPTSNDNTIATTAYVQEKIGHYLPLIGGTLTGSLNITNAQLAVTGVTGIITWQDRHNAAQIWGLYTDSGTARLWMNTTGDRFTVDTAGNGTIFGNFTVANALTVSNNGVNAATIAGDAQFAGNQVHIGGNGIEYFGNGHQEGFTWNGSHVLVYVDRSFLGYMAISDSNNNLTVNGVYANYVHSTGNVAADVDITAGRNIWASSTITGGYITSSGNVNANNAVTTSALYANNLYATSGGDITVLPSLYLINAVRLVNNCFVTGTNAGTYYPLCGIDTSGSSCFGSSELQTKLFGNDVVLVAHHYPLGNGNLVCGTTTYNWQTVCSYNFYTASDERLKTDIKELPNCLNLVQSLQPKSYKFKVETEDKELPPTGRDHWGFIAQDVGKALGADFGGYWKADDEHESINYNELVTVLWKAVQELSAKVT